MNPMERLAQTLNGFDPRQPSTSALSRSDLRNSTSSRSDLRNSATSARKSANAGCYWSPHGNGGATGELLTGIKAMKVKSIADEAAEVTRLWYMYVNPNGEMERSYRCLI